MNKHEHYRQLVQQRKTCSTCAALANAAEIDGGRYDSDRIGGYTRWQGNLDAELMVVAQDFADVDGFREARGWAGETTGTNLTLVELIAEVGITIQPPRRGHPDDRLFFTNAVLCMKQGGMQARIPSACYRECGRRFLRPMIELVAPRVVVTLGIGAMRATCESFGIDPPRRLATAVTQPVPLNSDSVLMPLYHPSRTVLNTTRSLEVQRQDWRQVGRVLRKRLAADRGASAPARAARSGSTSRTPVAGP